jgi:hypothetical protein
MSGEAGQATNPGACTDKRTRSWSRRSRRASVGTLAGRQQLRVANITPRIMPHEAWASKTGYRFGVIAFGVRASVGRVAGEGGGPRRSILFARLDLGRGDSGLDRGSHTQK